MSRGTNIKFPINPSMNQSKTSWASWIWINREYEIYLPAGRIGPVDATFDHCCGYSKDGTYYKGVEIPVDPNADLPPEWGQPFSPEPHPLPQLAPEPEPEP
eukprot:jgi/Psemu1/22841/gm1.22841_g